MKIINIINSPGLTIAPSPALPPLSTFEPQPLALDSFGAVTELTEPYFLHCPAIEPWHFELPLDFGDPRLCAWPKFEPVNHFAGHIKGLRDGCLDITGIDITTLGCGLKDELVDRGHHPRGLSKYFAYHLTIGSTPPAGQYTDDLGSPDAVEDLLSFLLSRAADPAIEKLREKKRAYQQMRADFKSGEHNDRRLLMDASDDLAEMSYEVCRELLLKQRQLGAIRRASQIQLPRNGC